MNKVFLYSIILVVGLFLVVISANNVFAYIIDGNLADWGVVPFSHWQPNSPNIDYVVEDGYSRTWSDTPFQEIYDLEAIYFDDDANNLYFSIVTSYPYINDWAHESLFIDFSGRTSEQILLDGANGYKYAADLASFPLNTLTTKGVYLVNQSKVFELDYWNGSPYHFPVSVAIDGWNGHNAFGYHTYLGSYQLYQQVYYGLENGGGATYIIEGAIPKSLFLPKECTMPAELYFSKVTCIKDWITLRGTKNSPCTVVPEPATCILLGWGLLGTAILRRRKKYNH